MSVFYLYLGDSSCWSSFFFLNGSLLGCLFLPVVQSSNGLDFLQISGCLTPSIHQGTEPAGLLIAAESHPFPANFQVIVMDIIID